LDGGFVVEIRLRGMFFERLGQRFGVRAEVRVRHVPAFGPLDAAECSWIW